MSLKTKLIVLLVLTMALATQRGAAAAGTCTEGGPGHCTCGDQNYWAYIELAFCENPTSLSENCDNACNQCTDNEHGLTGVPFCDGVFLVCDCTS